MTKSTLSYKGFLGSVSYSAEDDLLYGKIEGVSDLVLYEGRSIEEIKKDFEEAVDEYITECEKMGKDPMRAYRGTFNVRVAPELHRQVAETAVSYGTSLNQFVSSALAYAISHPEIIESRRGIKVKKAHGALMNTAKTKSAVDTLASSARHKAY
ncbi:MAG: type II toxin-antitoxin system HicB family antitoxin [Candidatus Eremiobacteraeota bacterium]|nr:type II toxin-antitoxin system HicB family antitoxin [Candidatus Eremiobacteraeota bacterium]